MSSVDLGALLGGPQGAPPDTGGPSGAITSDHTGERSTSSARRS
jgi:hypothetical protein